MRPCGPTTKNNQPSRRERMRIAQGGVRASERNPGMESALNRMRPGGPRELRHTMSCSHATSPVQMTRPARNRPALRGGEDYRRRPTQDFIRFRGFRPGLFSYRPSGTMPVRVSYRSKHRQCCAGILAGCPRSCPPRRKTWDCTNLTYCFLPAAPAHRACRCAHAAPRQMAARAHSSCGPHRALHAVRRPDGSHAS